jgi:hypothetical protein
MISVCCSSGTRHGPGMTGRRMSWRGRYEFGGKCVIQQAGEDTEEKTPRDASSGEFVIQ